MNSILLRNRPLDIMYNRAREVFNLTSRWNPINFMPKKFEEKSLTVIERFYGLQWQKGGSDLCSFDDIKHYIWALNSEEFAGYSDWRLPTTVELISLLEPEKQATGLYLNRLFDPKQEKCWGADHFGKNRWNVYFNRKRVFFDNSVSHYVKAVRKY